MPSKSTSKRGETALPKNRGTGFEDGYADPPMTPDEHAAEASIYHPGRPFHDRIEECIQRFQSRRRMTQDRAVLFNKFLALGGIDTTQRQFTGTANFVRDWKQEGFSADEIRNFTVNDTLAHDGDPKGKFFDPSCPEHWDVDFAGVVAGFLGTWLPGQVGLLGPEIRLATDTILNFLKYILHHDVCPEYNDNVNEAISVCNMVQIELPRIAAACRALPGDFNLACRILFCTSGKPQAKADFHVADPTTDGDDQLVFRDRDVEPGSGEIMKLPGALDNMFLVPASFNATAVFQTTIALHEPEQLPHVSDPNKLPRVVKVFEDCYEVKEIFRATETLIELYKGVSAQRPTERPIGPVGYVVLVPTIIEDGWDNHPTLAEGRANNPGKPISLYFDNAVLVNLDIGTKLRITVCELDVGIEFVREVTEILPSFYVFLPQSLMMHWKKPRPDERPPPSAEDPDAAERREMEDLELDEKETVKEQRKFDKQLDSDIQSLEVHEALEKAMARVRT